MGQIRHPASTSRPAKDRQDSAEELAEERAKRTPAQQVKALDALLGKGKGAVRERARLKKTIAAAKAEKAKAKEAKEEKKARHRRSSKTNTRSAS